MKKIEIDLSVDEIRDYFDGNELSKLDDALDEAQGAVFSGDEQKVLIYVVVSH